MNKSILVAGPILGILGIVLDAFGAHGLEKLVDADAVNTFETGVRYQIYHAFFLLIVGTKRTSTLTLRIVVLHWNTVCFDVFTISWVFGSGRRNHCL